MNTIDELILAMESTPEQFNHLKIFLHRKHTKLAPEFGREFLFVSHDAFGLVKLQDLTFEDNYIHLLLEEVTSGHVTEFKIDIRNNVFPFLMIAWEDLLEIAKQENKRVNSESELLDFEF